MRMTIAIILGILLVQAASASAGQKVGHATMARKPSFAVNRQTMMRKAGKDPLPYLPLQSTGKTLALANKSSFPALGLTKTTVVSRTGFKTVRGEGDSPDHGLRHGALLRGLRKIGTVPDGFETSSSPRFVSAGPSGISIPYPLTASQPVRTGQGNGGVVPLPPRSIAAPLAEYPLGPILMVIASLAP
jgi:hypothetical protein